MRALMMGRSIPPAPRANTSNAVAMGYCFGARRCWNWRAPGADLKGFRDLSWRSRNPGGAGLHQDQRAKSWDAAPPTPPSPWIGFSRAGQRRWRRRRQHEMVTYGGAPTPSRYSVTSAIGKTPIASLGRCSTSFDQVAEITVRRAGVAGKLPARERRRRVAGRCAVKAAAWGFRTSPVPPPDGHSRLSFRPAPFHLAGPFPHCPARRDSAYPEASGNRPWRGGAITRIN